MFAPVEEEVGDAEAEQDQQVEVGDPPQPPPVEEADEEEEAERDPDERRVQRVGELAGVAAGHFPGDLVAGPRLGHFPGLRVDHDQRVLVVVFEPADFPAFVLEGRAGERCGCSRFSLIDLRVLRRGLRRFGRGDVAGRRVPRRFAAPAGARAPEQGEERGAARAAPPHHARRHHSPPRPKWARIAGATSRRRPLLALVGRLRAAADEEQRPEAVAGVEGAVAAAAGVGHAAPVDRLEAVARARARSRPSAARSAPTRPAAADRGRRRCAACRPRPRLQHAELALDLPAPAAQVGDLVAGTEAQLPRRRARPPPTRRPPAGIPGSGR